MVGIKDNGVSSAKQYSRLIPNPYGVIVGENDLGA